MSTEPVYDPAAVPVPAVLKTLHRLRKHLKALQDEIDRGPRVLAARQQNMTAAEKTHAAAHDALKKLKLQQKDDEGSLKQAEQRLAKLSADIHSAGSKKEFDAKTHEIEFTTTKKGELEDAILAAMTEIEERTADLPTVDTTWADARAEFAEYQTEAQARLERLLADQAATQAELAETEAKLPADVKPKYDRLVKTHGPDAMAGVNGRTCQHCRTTVTEQVKNNLTGGAFVCCPNCGRGLYLVE